MVHLLTLALLATPAAEPIDIPFDAPAGPQLIRIHIEMDGKPVGEAYQLARREYLRAMFAWLDRNKDGVLDEAEARRAPLPVLSADLPTEDAHIAFNFRALDLNGDGKVALDELDEYYREFEDGPFSMLAGGMRPASPNVEFLQQLGRLPRQAPITLLPDLFPYLDEKRDGKLSKDAVAAAAKVLARLDTDNDELLDPTELGGSSSNSAVVEMPTVWIRSDERLRKHAGRKPDLELRIRLGEIEKGKARLEIVNSKGKTIVSRPDEAVIQLGGARLDLRCDRSWLTPKQLTTLQDRYRRDVRNQDVEYRERVLGAQAKMMALRSAMRVSNAGTGLWEILDRDRDGILAMREVRAAPGVLATLDLNGDGVITKDEVCTSYVVQFGPGRTHFKRPSGSEVVTLNNQGKLAYVGEDVAGGPLWFRKMDRNGDDEVSQAEFLGTQDQFRKLDLDADGYISREESEKAEERRK